MASRSLLGRRIRRLRQEQALSQVELARRLGISASYLNLIEHNQRPLTHKLLLKLADSFDFDLQAYSQDADDRCLSELQEMFGDGLFAEMAPAEAEVREMIDAAPTASRAMLSLYRAYRNARDDALALSERLTSDSFLSTSPHELRTMMTSIRSFSEILMDYDELEADKRQQFVGILVDESQRLSLIINEMLAFAADPEKGFHNETATVADEVSDFLQERNNRFEEIEVAADDLRSQAKLAMPNDAVAMAELLKRRGKVSVEIVDGPLPGSRLVLEDPEQNCLRLSAALPSSSRCFQIAKFLGGRGHAALFESLVEDSRLSSREARALAKDVLAGSFAAALLMPYEMFRQAAVDVRYDIERLQARFNASFEQVCQRLASLTRPGARGVPFHFLRVDIAGNLSKRFTASGLQIARFGGVCPRMAVHRAFLGPDRLVTQIAEMPNGTSYFEIARAFAKPAAGYSEPRSWYAVSLGCDLGFAGELVYADDLQTDPPKSAVPIGSSCRLCDRGECRQRAAPPVLPSLPHGDGLLSQPGRP